jgi:DNA-binding response OmpR family regulator
MRAGDEATTPAGPPADGTRHGGWPADAFRALVVSGSPIWRNEIAALLDLEGFVVHMVDGGGAALQVGGAVDIALVDLSGHRDATSNIAALRARTPAPILAISPEVLREHEVLEVYAAGSDQCVTRRVQPPELMARVRALLRQGPPSLRGAAPPPAGCPSGPIALDPVTGAATAAGVEILLSEGERAILEILLQRAGRVVTREQLMGPPGRRRAHSALDGVVRSLRKKLEAAEGFRRIVTIRGVGFRLADDIELVPWPAADAQVVDLDAASGAPRTPSVERTVPLAAPEAPRLPELTGVRRAERV